MNGPKSHRDGSITGMVVGATPVVAPTPNEWADEASGEKDATDDDIDAAFMAFLRLQNTRPKHARQGSSRGKAQPRHSAVSASPDHPLCGTSQTKRKEVHNRQPSLPALPVAPPSMAEKTYPVAAEDDTGTPNADEPAGTNAAPRPSMTPTFRQTTQAALASGDEGAGRWWGECWVPTAAVGGGETQ